MSLRVLTALLWRDLQLFVADRRALCAAFLLPIAMASFFGFILASAMDGSRATRLPLQVVDQDASPTSRRVLDRLAADAALAASPATFEAARAEVRAGRAVLAIVLPPGFEAQAARALVGGEPPPAIALLHDPARPAEVAIARGLALAHLAAAVGDGARAGVPLTAPYAITEIATSGPPGGAYNPYAHAFVGIGVQFILMASLDAGVAVLAQRRRGVWQRLRAAPLTRRMLIGARALSGALIALAVLLVAIGFGAVAFGIRVEGSVLGFLGVSVAAALMASAFGVLVAALGRTPEATRTTATFVTLVVVMVGGAWIPPVFFPAWLQDVAALSPAKWAIDGLDAMLWRGLDLGAALTPIAVLLGFAAVFFAVAVLRFRWDPE